MRWRKLGNIFCPDGHQEWMYSHASNTVAEYLGNDFFKIYFSTRDKQSRSSIGYVIAELKSTLNITEISEQPVLSPGEIGLFDDSGVSLSCITSINGKKHLFYLGWNLGVTVPWRNSIGLAIYDEDQGQYIKQSKAPLLDRSAVDPYSISYPFILQDGPLFHMWYGSNLTWGHNQNDMAHLIKYAYSHDGSNWVREGNIALHFKNSTEYAMSRPWVTKESGIYKMWYSYRGDRYRIGYAESTDAILWNRKDELSGIDISETGWDSQCVEYPFLFDHRGQKYMLYNGNAYGKTGFGLAIMESST